MNRKYIVDISINTEQQNHSHRRGSTLSTSMKVSYVTMLSTVLRSSTSSSICTRARLKSDLSGFNHVSTNGWNSGPHAAQYFSATALRHTNLILALSAPSSWESRSTHQVENKSTGGRRRCSESLKCMLAHTRK